MRQILDLDRYPLDRPGIAWMGDTGAALPRRSGAATACTISRAWCGRKRLQRAVAELRPVIDTLSFTHRRRHNIYFRKEIPGLRGRPSCTRHDRDRESHGLRGPDHAGGSALDL